MESRLLSSQLAKELISVDRQIDAITATRVRYSLAPGSKQARSLYEVCQRVLMPYDTTEIAEVFVQGICGIARAQIENFPENLFWDYEFMAATLLEQARVISTEKVADLCAKMIRIHQLYGQKTSICFRYVHDFVYGFDWAKWVRKHPQERAHIGPFAETFIHSMEERGYELLALIRKNDTKYPQLAKGKARNPFGFSRQPQDELRLHRHLADKALIPVPAWSVNAKPQWQHNYIQLRSNEARALGLDGPP